jgi:hypothetical protein
VPQTGKEEPKRRRLWRSLVLKGFLPPIYLVATVQKEEAMEEEEEDDIETQTEVMKQGAPEEEIDIESDQFGTGERGFGSSTRR